MTAAPERRKGPLGQSQVRVGNEWLDEDAPGTMAAWAAAQATERKAAIGKPTKPPTKRQQQIWDAVARHGTQAEAARLLGVSQAAIQSGLKGYKRAMGIDGPLPGGQLGKGKPKAKATSDTKVSPAASSDTDHAEGIARPPLDDSIANVEPVDAETQAETFEEWFERSGRPASGTATSLGSAEYELRLSLAGTDPFKAGYARGFAVAMLRVIAQWEHADLPEFLQTMASDAADGLMA